jgi:hypothetical protein
VRSFIDGSSVFEGADEVKAHDRVSLTEVEAMGVAAMCPGIELYAGAAPPPGDLDEVLVEQAAIAVRSPLLAGHEVIDIHVKAAGEIRHQPVPGARTAFVAVENTDDSVAIVVAYVVAATELLLVEVGPQLTHDGKDSSEPLVPRRKLDDFHR